MATEKLRKLIITGPELGEPVEIPMQKAGVATIGRGADNSLRVRHPLVSRQHAEIRGTPTQCQVVDLDSTYGTLVNGQRIEPHKVIALSNGDVIDIGPYRLTFEETELVVTPTTPIIKPDETEPAIQPPATTANGHRPRQGKKPPLPPTEPVSGYNNGVVLPPGLSFTYSRYLQYLPEIYHTEFMGKFLALFESIMAPLEWQVENFDLYLSPRTAPAAFLPWLANWFDIVFDESWGEEQRRQLLNEAHFIYSRRGTKASLERLLEIYTGSKPEITDVNERLEPFTFEIRINKRERDVNRVLIEHLIEVNKPAYTSYQLSFSG